MNNKIYENFEMPVSISIVFELKLSVWTQTDCYEI